MLAKVLKTQGIIPVFVPVVLMNTVNIWQNDFNIMELHET